MTNYAEQLLRELREHPDFSVPDTHEETLVETLVDVMNYIPREATPHTQEEGAAYYATRQAFGAELIHAFVAGGKKISNRLTGDPLNNIAGLCMQFFGMQAWNAGRLDGDTMTDDNLHALMRKGPEWIQFAYINGVRFRPCQDTDGKTLLMTAADVVMHAIFNGTEKPAFEPLDAVRAYLECGGPVTNAKDIYGKTEAHYIAAHAVQTLPLFVKMGGLITDAQDEDGYTLASAVLCKDGNALREYIRHGGKFFPDKLTRGRSEAALASMHPNDALRIYLEEGAAAGARMTGVTEFLAARRGADTIRICHKHGIRFSDAKNAEGKTSRQLAMENPDKHEALKAYDECVAKQGGLKKEPTGVKRRPKF